MQIPISSVSAAAAANAAPLRNASANHDATTKAASGQPLAQSEQSQDRDANEHYDDLNRKQRNKNTESEKHGAPASGAPPSLLQLEAEDPEGQSRLDLRG
jgi:hypothetical protein